MLFVFQKAYTYKMAKIHPFFQLHSQELQRAVGSICEKLNPDFIMSRISHGIYFKIIQNIHPIYVIAKQLFL